MMDMGVGGISGPDADLNAIKQTWGLPFVRVAFGGLTRATWLYWYNNQAAYLAYLDVVVASAEKYGIGLIPVLFWDFTSFTDLTYTAYGTFQPPSKAADLTSNAWALCSQFITQIVSRYAKSPSIYAWEIGNEMAANIGAEYNSSWALDGTYAAWLNWGARPDGPNYVAGDKLSLTYYNIWTENCIQLIKAIDKSGRFISSGNSLGRPYAVTAQNTSSTASDSFVQWSSGIGTSGLPWIVYRDQYFSGVSQHIYPKLTNDGAHFSDNDMTFTQLIAASKVWTDSVNKPLYLGEFGSCFTDPAGDPVSVDLTTETANFNGFLSAIINNNVPLSSAWNYGGNVSGVAAWMKWKMSDPSRMYQMILLANANAGMSNS